jgi:hypothetical protein
MTSVISSSEAERLYHYARGLRRFRHVVQAIIALEIRGCPWGKLTGWTDSCGVQIGEIFKKFREEDPVAFEWIMRGKIHATDSRPKEN